jgi:hypothetical protein
MYRVFSDLTLPASSKMCYYVNSLSQGCHNIKTNIISRVLFFNERLFLSQYFELQGFSAVCKKVVCAES